MAVYATYVFVGCILSIVLNLFFLLVTHLRRVEGFQEVLVFMRNISIGYILMAFCLMGIVPQSITNGTSIIRISYGKLEYFDANFLFERACAAKISVFEELMERTKSVYLFKLIITAWNIVSSIGCGIFLYTIMCSCILFFYRYNVTCKTSTLSTIFSRKNILVFLISAGIFCFIQSVLIYYSAVDSMYLREKFNRIQDDRDDAISSVTQTSAIANVNIITNPIPTTSPQGNDESQHVPITVGQSISYIQDVSKRTIFGWDFQKNPMIFLSLGIYTVTAVLSSIGVFAISIIVFCKLHRTENYGKESMSGKSKDEQILLTKILMVTAYVPIILAGILGANFLVCFIRQKSMLFQELLIGYIVPWIGITFPVFIILLIPALRVTTFLILTCQIWKENANTGDSDLNGNTINNSRMAVRETEADGRLSDDQLRALSNMTR